MTLPELTGIDAEALLEQLGALGLAAACVDEDGRVCGTNEPFQQLTGASVERLTGASLNEFLETTAAEHKSYGDGVVYRFASRKGEKWLRPKRGRAQATGVVTFTDVTAEWSMLGKLVASIDVRDRLMRDADIGMFRYNPDDETFHFSDALVRRGEALSVYRLDDIAAAIVPSSR